MAQKYDRRRYGYTDGSLAYDLDALARERALEEAGRVEEERREPAAAPRRQPVESSCRVFLIIRSSREWKLMTARRPPGRRASEAA